MIIIRDYKILVLPFLFLLQTAMGQLKSPSFSDTSHGYALPTNPILYGEILVGGTGDEAGGLSGGLELNLQWKRSLFSIRAISNSSSGAYFPFVAGFVLIPIPVLYTNHTSSELAVLYGWRFIQNWTAINISVGISTNTLDQYSLIRDSVNKANSTNPLTGTYQYIGLPIEVTFHIFKGYKRRIRVLYGIIPLGKPTALGESIGLKFIGNLSTKPYYGVVLSIGLGYHKLYK